MKKLFIILMVIFIGRTACADDPKVGQITKTWNLGWVVVKNIKGVQNGNVDFKFGETCNVGYGQAVKIIAIREHDVLVRLVGVDPTYGTSCPEGTIFFIEKEQFKKMGKLYGLHQKSIDAEKKGIHKLLSK